MMNVLRGLCILGLFYALLLFTCIAVMQVLGLIFHVPNATMVGIAVWFLFCLGSLCVPDEVWNKWLLKK